MKDSSDVIPAQQDEDLELAIKLQERGSIVLKPPEQTQQATTRSQYVTIPKFANNPKPSPSTGGPPPPPPVTNGRTNHYMHIPTFSSSSISPRTPPGPTVYSSFAQL